MPPTITSRKASSSTRIRAVCASIRSAASSPSGLSEPVDTKADAPLSLNDELTKVFKEDAEAKAKPEKVEAPAKDEKPVEAVKPAAKEAAPKDEKPAEAATAEADKATPAPEAKPEEKADARQHQEPPKNFLPDAKEMWKNVPRSVRRDIETMTRSHDEATAKFKDVADRYETVRDFDELARSNGRELRDSLTKMHHAENLIQRNPIAGLNAILMEVGPRKPDGQPVSLFEVAQHIVQQGPQGYQQAMQQAQQVQQRPAEDPRVSHLQQQLQQMQEQTLAMQVIQPFKAEHPRYDELQEDIAFFLKSGKIPQSLSPYDRLAAAYDMAARINPASHVEETPATGDEGPDRERRAGEDFSGPKSIKSSPGSVTEAVNDQGQDDESIRDSLRKELRRLNRA